MRALTVVALLALLGTAMTQELDFLQVFTCHGFTVMNGRVLPNRGTFVHQDRVKVTCNVGYELIGAHTHTCDENYGGWNSNRPACVVIQVTCHNPGLENGAMERPSFNGDIEVVEVLSPRSVIFAGDRVTFKCAEKFKMQMGGQPYEEDHQIVAVCQGNGAWSQQIPTCKKEETKCVNPIVEGASLRRWGNNLNGLEKVSGSDSFFAGDLLEIQCQEGFEMSIPSQEDSDAEFPDHMMTNLKCLENGEWNKKLPKCTQFKCGVPTVGAGLSVLGGVDQDFFHGDWVNYTCLSGYELLGPSRRICRMDLNQWFPHSPSCRRLRCPTLKWPEEGHYITSKDFNLLKAGCNEGHELIGSPERKCLTNGSWSGTPVTCQGYDPALAECHDPGTPDGGYLSHDDFTVGKTINYRCSEGFILLGERQSTCAENRNWTSPRVKCLGPNEYMDPENAVNRWKEIVDEIETENHTGGDHHVYILADSSGSITNSELNAEKAFIGIVANQFKHTALSLVVFNSTAVLLANQTDSMGIINALRYNKFSSGGGTSIKKALSFVKTGPGAQKSVIIILNDAINEKGNLYNVLARRWRERQGRPTVYAVTMGGYVNRMDLIRAASFKKPNLHPVIDYLFFFKTYADLNKLAYGMRAKP